MTNTVNGAQPYIMEFTLNRLVNLGVVAIVTADAKNAQRTALWLTECAYLPVAKWKCGDLHVNLAPRLSATRVALLRDRQRWPARASPGPCFVACGRTS